MKILQKLWNQFLSIFMRENKSWEKLFYVYNLKHNNNNNFMLENIYKFFVKNTDNNKKNIGTFDKKEIIYDKIALKVLNKNQQNFKKLLEDFSTTHFLGWWTAIALQLGHRESIDFDFFSNWNQWNFSDFVKKIWKYNFEVSEKDKKSFYWIEFIDQEEIHVEIDNVKLSLINFYRTLYDDQKINISWEKYILNWLKIASLEELSAMKVFAMIWRKKWKDAVDLYFLIKELKINLSEILKLAQKKYFINIFNSENVLEQLISKNWDKTEKVNYLIQNPPKDKEIEIFLEKEALKILKNK